MALPLLVGLLVVLLFLPTLVQEEPVTRLKVPAVEPAPKAPAKRPHKDSRVASGTTRVEATLSQEKTGLLRSRLEQIAQKYPAAYGVVVFDPSTEETVAIDPDRSFLAASLNKLPVLMTLYRAAAHGELDLDDEISMQASDVQAYGTGVLYTRPIGYTMTLRECARYLIKESDNTAWKMLDRYLGREDIRAELYRVGADSTEYWIPNTTTPNDVLLMLQKVSDPAYTSPELSAEMLDLMTNTSFEDRLPEPLPEGTQVSHKIGSYGSTFADAGAVFTQGSHDTRDAYFMVVLVSDTTESAARAAMQEMSLATYRVLTDTLDSGAANQASTHRKHQTQRPSD